MLKVYLKKAIFPVVALGIGSIFLIEYQTRKFERVELTYAAIKDYKDIVPVNDSIVIPIIYSNSFSLKSLSVKEKKEKFIQMILPSVLVIKHGIEQDALLVMELQNKSIGEAEREKLHYLKKKYGTDNLAELTIRAKSHPTSIVLAQAAIESGWGTSDFFLKANNIFGVWANSETKQRIKANATRDGKPIYLKKYNTLSASIQDYYLTIAKVKAYKKFRAKRLTTDQPFKLIPHLNKYSELGRIYTRRIRQVIKENDLTIYDNYQIHPDYIQRIRQVDLSD
jgi:Bax protein